MYRLVVTEKSSVGQSIAAALGVTGRKDGYMEGGGWLISWCVGHLAELSEPAAYDPDYAKWRQDDLPILPESWRFTIRAHSCHESTFSFKAVARGKRYYCGA